VKFKQRESRGKRISGLRPTILAVAMLVLSFGSVVGAAGAGTAGRG
jgi:hypothetical protein